MTTQAPRAEDPSWQQNHRDWKYFDEKLSELREKDVEAIIARGRLMIEAHDELEHGSYEATVKRHFNLSYARKLRIIAAHPVVSEQLKAAKAEIDRLKQIVGGEHLFDPSNTSDRQIAETMIGRLEGWRGRARRVARLMFAILDQQKKQEGKSES